MDDLHDDAKEAPTDGAHRNAAQQAIIDSAPEAEQALTDLVSVATDVGVRLNADIGAHRVSNDDVADLRAIDVRADAKMQEDYASYAARHDQLVDGYLGDTAKNAEGVAPVDQTIKHNDVEAELRQNHAAHALDDMQTVLDQTRARFQVLDHVEGGQDEVKDYSARLDQVQQEISMARQAAHDHVEKDRTDQDRSAYVTSLAKDLTSTNESLIEVTTHEVTLLSNDLIVEVRLESEAQDGVKEANAILDTQKALIGQAHHEIEQAKPLLDPASSATEGAPQPTQEQAPGAVNAGAGPLADAYGHLAGAGTSFDQVDALNPALKESFAQEDRLQGQIAAAFETGKQDQAVVGKVDAEMAPILAERDAVSAARDKLLTEHPEGAPLNELRDLAARAHDLADRAHGASAELLPELERSAATQREEDAVQTQSVPAAGHPTDQVLGPVDTGSGFAVVVAGHESGDAIVETAWAAAADSGPTDRGVVNPINQQNGYVISALAVEGHQGEALVAQSYRDEAAPAEAVAHDAAAPGAPSGHDPAASDAASAAASDDHAADLQASQASLSASSVEQAYSER